MYRKIILTILFLLAVAFATKVAVNSLFTEIFITPFLQNSKAITETNETINSINYWDYVDEVNNAQDWNAVKLDKNGNATYRGKVILTEKGLPLNDENAYTTPEIKTMLFLKGTKPKEDCAPNDPKNGSMGCYINNPDEME